ncbi:MAG: tetratricopeptide repeat protein, partial [Chloroflexota bacterium]|nr:tetratricopeptide repeat protein [Chloroflexota bacterium]
MSRKSRFREDDEENGLDDEGEEGLGPPIDRRAFERGLAEMGRLLDGREFDSQEELDTFLNKFSNGEMPLDLRPLTPLQEAQELMYDAWEATGRRRAALAHQALRISKDCADAYVLLAEETAETWEEARALYARGVEAGERALGSEAFEKDVGYFWGLLETRPYMRARAGLAECLWELGQHEEAIAHYKDMLRLNPNDNQGIRYLLADCLLVHGDDEALGELLEQYPDEITANWAYTWALYTFRQQGASALANQRLKEALDVNPFVPPYMLGRKRFPDTLPDYVGFGDESEAVAYVFRAMESWFETKGAIPWLAEQSA